MKGALSDTVYRGLPFVGGQPPPHRTAILFGIRGPRYPSTHARAVGPSEGKFRRCLSGLATGNVDDSSTFVARKGRT